jgi:hypothetical protein
VRTSRVDHGWWYDALSTLKSIPGQWVALATMASGGSARTQASMLRNRNQTYTHVRLPTGQFDIRSTGPTILAQFVG